MLKSVWLRLTAIRLSAGGALRTASNFCASEGLIASSLGRGGRGGGGLDGLASAVTQKDLFGVASKYLFT